ncbi:tetratricopeptide repeat-containing glycosyltransferase family 2 protein [Effusibacillus pohliae]|uniref:tetratricopeptide repeat-containing glycosyltransferase family 2 protein n=1 Tax=Effusibacillus pohliae TaxID=232270 RepID=UPI0003760D57|nr:glycosyltransferase [Effusibacillus pohliae]
MSFDISLCMTVQNEEEFLERCLASVSGVVSEIIVVDTGSTDKTVEIAKRFGASVIPVPWEYDFAKARNAGLSRATKKWILVLDADEELEPPDADYLNGLLQQEQVYGYFLKIINYIGGSDDGEYVTDSVCRLFRNHPDIRFTSSIHEEVVPSIRQIAAAQIEFSDITVRHYGYLQEVIDRKRKNERNWTILQRAIERQPDDLRLQYALATEYFQRQKYAEALALFESILPRVPIFSGYDSDLLLKTAYALRETGRQQDACRIIEEALVFYPDFTDLLDLKGMLLLENEQYQNAQSTFLQAINIGDVSFKYTSASGSGTYRSHFLAGLACEYLCVWQQAKHHYVQAVRQNPAYLPAWRRLLAILLLAGETEEVSALLTKSGNQVPERARRLLIQVALNHREPDFAMRILACGNVSEVSDPILKGILLTQTDQYEQAKIVWTLAPKAVRHLYLWALLLQENDTSAAMKQLEQFVILDPSFSSIEAMLKGDEPIHISETAYRQCQQVLVQVGAWDGLIWLQSQVPLAVAWPWLPVHVLCGLRKAPAAAKRQLLALCNMRRERLTYQERLAAGLLAYDCSDFAASHGWYSEAQREFPNRVAPRIALLHLYTSAARSVSGQPLAALDSDLQFLTLCE